MRESYDAEDTVAIYLEKMKNLCKNFKSTLSFLSQWRLIFFMKDFLEVKKYTGNCMSNSDNFEQDFKIFIGMQDLHSENKVT